jgi:hypothetical protein
MVGTVPTFNTVITTVVLLQFKSQLLCRPMAALGHGDQLETILEEKMQGTNQAS